MMTHDSAALQALYLGGTGTISASCVRLSVETGMRVAVLDRIVDAYHAARHAFSERAPKEAVS